ncbi:hypothetical protein D3C78_1228630 [compost metagenome]
MHTSEQPIDIGKIILDIQTEVLENWSIWFRYRYENDAWSQWEEIHLDDREIEYE